MERETIKNWKRKHSDLKSWLAKQLGEQEYRKQRQGRPKKKKELTGDQYEVDPSFPNGECSVKDINEKTEKDNDEEKYISRTISSSWQNLPIRDYLKYRISEKDQRAWILILLFLWKANQKDVDPFLLKFTSFLWNKIRWGIVYRELSSIGNRDIRAKFKTEDGKEYKDMRVSWMENRPLRYIRSAISRYKKERFRKKDSKSEGITGQDLFDKRREIGHKDLIQEAFISRYVKAGNKKTMPGLFDLAGKYSSDESEFSHYIFHRLKWKIHDICQDPSWQENDESHFADIRSASNRGQSFDEIEADLGEGKFERLLKGELLKSKHRDEWAALFEDNDETGEGKIKAKAKRWEMPFEFRMRFELALETSLTNRQKQIIKLRREGYEYESKKGPDIAGKLGLSARRIRTLRNNAFRKLRGKFPGRVVQKPIDDSHLDIDLYFISNDIRRLKCNCSEVGQYEFIDEGKTKVCPYCGRKLQGERIQWQRIEARDPEEEQEGERIRAGFHAYSEEPPLYGYNTVYNPEPGKMVYFGITFREFLEWALTIPEKQLERSHELFKKMLEGLS